MSEYIFNIEEHALLNVLERIKDCEVFEDENSYKLLVELVRRIRPKAYWQYEYAQHQIEFLTYILQTNQDVKVKLQQLLSHVFIRSDLSEVLIVSGIQSEHSFFYELNKRMRHKFLPALKRKDSFLYAIGTIFYKKKDYIWVERIENQIWLNLFRTLDFELDLKNTKLISQLSFSVKVLSTRISALGIDHEIVRSTTLDKVQYFIEQNRVAHKLVDAIDDFHSNKKQQDIIADKLLKRLKNCEKIVDEIRAHIPDRGTNLRQTYLLLTLNRLIERLRLVLDILDNDGMLDLPHLVNMFKIIIRNENTQNSLRHHIKDNVQFLAYRIVEHEHNTGEHYITSTIGEYNRMLLSALSGGFIIGFVAFMKNLLHLIRMAPFWQGFAYSVNYATGFIAIYASGSTLATKQPAMTASTIAHALDDRKANSPNLPELAILISKVWRSQTASFIGNIVMTFPVSMLLAFVWYWIFGFNIAEGEQGQALIDAQNPLKTPIYIYAIYTGIFLYISGLISGYFDNLSIYGNIPERLRDHPTLRRTIALPRINKIADYVSKNLGGIMGNICLGFMLGMAGVVEYVFGIDFDIRHITISTGNFAIGLQGLHFEASLSDILWTSFGVLLIGFLNFAVSFSLAFFTALVSRRVKFREYRRFSTYVLRLFRRYPLDFIRPPAKTRKPAHFIRKRIKLKK